jgi:hypothetical protein
MAVPIRSHQSLHDPVRRAHRRALLWRVLRWVIVVIVIAAFVGCGGWWLWHHRPHANAPVVQRTPIGIWCRQNACQYFDRSAALWGSAILSHGPLLLLVQDDQTYASASPELIRNILVAVDGLPDMGMHAQSVELPDTAPGDMRITVDRPYTLLFDVQGDIADQLSTLSVLLADRAKDTAWAPQYIDLRTPGRVYYK